MRSGLTLGIHSPVVVAVVVVVDLLLHSPRGESPSRNLVDRCDGAAVESRARRNHERVAVLQGWRSIVVPSQGSGPGIPVWI